MRTPAPVVRGRFVPRWRVLAGIVEQWREQYGSVVLVVAYDASLQVAGRWHWRLSGSVSAFGDCLERDDLTTQVEAALRAIGAPQASAERKLQ